MKEGGIEIDIYEKPQGQKLASTQATCKIENNHRVQRVTCPSSGALRQFETFVKGGSGSISVSA